MTPMRSSRIAPGLAALLLLAAVGSLSADPLPPPSYFEPQSSTSYSPLVPVSSFARPSWFDRSRLQVSTSVSVGTGWNGGTDALQVTSLSYQLASPLAVRVSLGNAFGKGVAGNGMFLEGFAVAYRPHPSFQINVDYRDVRSPLQYQNAYGYGGYGGYGGFGR